jgi:N-acetylglutamate synthase-like GNAT family acetyltransferase
VNDCILKTLSDSRQKRMTQNFTIRQARPGDHAARVALLAPGYGADAAGLATEATDIRRRFRDFGDLASGIVQLVAEDANGAILGAQEATVRLYANDCESVGVIFLDGIAIAPTCRETGIAAALLARLEDIAREAGIAKIASNSRIDDAVGADFHLANGFAEAESAACFVRKIDG